MNPIQKNFLALSSLFAVLALGSTPLFSQVSLSVVIAPPPLEVDTQPACPDDGYMWTPGYWTYGDNTYSWVPGSWVQPPQVGEFWTPAYWGWDGSAFEFYSGYWGPKVGYYGGINYGYGYGGNGYGGGRWQGGHFSYNTAVNNVSSANIHNTYSDRTAINGNASKVKLQWRQRRGSGPTHGRTAAVLQRAEHPAGSGAAIGSGRSRPGYGPTQSRSPAGTGPGAATGASATTVLARTTGASVTTVIAGTTRASARAGPAETRNPFIAAGRPANPRQADRGTA